MKILSHVDETGRAVMVDVSAKIPQLRIAKAAGSIRLGKTAVSLIRSNALKKGDVFAVAQIAGIQAAKKTSELIPLCHPLPLSNVDVKVHLEEDGVRVTSEVRCVAQTGAEMEALVAVAAALLTVYDMCKAVDKRMTIDRISLLEKVKLPAASLPPKSKKSGSRRA